ncbi:methylated-DNA--[protein]-cysteine S-methyltransferase [Salibacterium salarium]|uniref:Methylated-DNA--protein-cysteine methyltransferase n=1 Tax=Salibacterium salarium TaxID=284579 RepID=A0A3R9P142_9BACI|nr:methylated-DNA--[protein]-cysteine S-methyltransferase [Salibacterium salarium]RSL30522.1 methylated-DNA--[protein]-cysteine S-methyltransferase [Salibacterium salarium]
MTTAEKLYYTQVNTRVGPLTIAATEHGLCALHFGESDTVIEAMKPWVQKHDIAASMEQDFKKLQSVTEQLHEYFAGERKTFDIALDLYGTPFQRSAWQALKQIPYGETRSYKQIAEVIGSPKAVRAIGSANNKNPVSIIVPCHRVIGSNGKMVGYGSGIDKKEHLLKMEGVL